MRTCVWCDGPLPEPQHKGHQKREFCSDSCKQKHYLWHKKMRQDADILAEPYWKIVYRNLAEQCKWLEEKLQERINDLKKEREYTDSLERKVQHYIKKAEAIQADCAARMKAVDCRNLFRFFRSITFHRNAFDQPVERINTISCKMGPDM